MPTAFVKVLFIWSLIAVCSGAITKNVWTFVPVEEQLTTLQKLCIQNIQTYAQKSGFAFNLLTNSNYTSVLTDKQQIQMLLQSSQIDISLSLPALLQLQVLIQHGGVWIDASNILVESLSWLDTLKNQRFINNRIDDPEVVMFYEPSWFEQTHKVTHPKIENLVLAPYYKTWFMAAQKGASYLQHLKVLFKEALTKSYQKNAESFSEAGYEVVDYLLDESQFFEWIARLTVQISQKQLDKQTNPRKLAISEYKIAGIDLTSSAQVVAESAKNHVDLTCKYLAELTLNELDVNLHYLVRLDKQVVYQLYQTLDREYINLDRFHSAGVLLCDQEAIPLRYVVNNSIIERYLLAASSSGIPVYDSEFIHHHCEGSFNQVYLLAFNKYLLPILALALNCFLTRKALLILKPELGVIPNQGLKDQGGPIN